MRLTILGCSGSVPGPDAAASGYLLEADGFVLGIELGNGALARLQAVRDPFDLDALVFSHLHPDHCADFSALTVLRRYHPDPPYDTRPARLPVYGPAEAPQRLANAYAPHESERRTTDLSDVFDFHTITTGTHRIGPFEMAALPGEHPTMSFALRFGCGGRTLAYTGDTGPSVTLPDVVRGADVLLAEASWTDAPDRPAGVHLSGRQAGELARAAHVERLLLTHIAPWTSRAAVLTEAEAAFGGDTRAVAQGEVYTV